MGFTDKALLSFVWNRLLSKKWSAIPEDGNADLSGM